MKPTGVVIVEWHHVHSLIAMIWRSSSKGENGVAMYTEYDDEGKPQLIVQSKEGYEKEYGEISNED